MPGFEVAGDQVNRRLRFYLIRNKYPVLNRRHVIRLICKEGQHLLGLQLYFLSHGAAHWEVYAFDCVYPLVEDVLRPIAALTSSAVRVQVILSCCQGDQEEVKPTILARTTTIGVEETLRAALSSNLGQPRMVVNDELAGISVFQASKDGHRSYRCSMGTLFILWLCRGLELQSFCQRTSRRWLPAYTFPYAAQGVIFHSLRSEDCSGVQTPTVTCFQKGARVCDRKEEEHGSVNILHYLVALLALLCFYFYKE